MANHHFDLLKNSNLFFLLPAKKIIESWAGFLLVFSVLYFFSSIFYGLDFTDSFYHLNRALNPAEGIHTYPSLLSSIFLKGIVEVVGSEVIYLRFINSLLLLCAVLSPFFLIKTQISRNEVLLYIAGTLFLFTPFNVNILGYDTISIFVLSVTFSFAVLYLQRPRASLLLLLAILSAVAVLSRLPNLAVIPILFLAIVFSHRAESRYLIGRSPVLYLFLSLTLIFLGFALYYSSFSDFFRASTNSQHHSLSFLLYNYLWHGLILLVFISVVLGGYYSFHAVRNNSSKVLFLGAIGVFFFFFLLLFIIRTRYSQNYSLFLTSLALSVVITLILKTRKDWRSFEHCVLYLYVLFLFINPFGSNTGLLKATSLFLLLPFILAFQSWKLDKFWLFLFIMLVPFSLIENISRTYEDSSIPELNKTLQLELLYPIKTSEIRASYLSEIDAEMSLLQQKNVQVYFYGDKSHIFHYLYPETTLHINSFYQPVEELKFYPYIEQRIQNTQRQAIFLTDSYPGNNSRDENLLGRKLIEAGFTLIKRNTFTYYLGP